MALKSRWLRTTSNGRRLQFYDGLYSAVGGAGIDFGQINSTALLHGGGSSTYPLTTATADSKFISYYTRSTATSGDMRAEYVRLELDGTIASTGYGDCIRAWTKVGGTGYSYATGLHATCSIDAGATVTGSSSGARITYGAAASTRTLQGAVSALHLCSDVGANNTMPTHNAWIRCTIDAASGVGFGYLVQLPSAASNSTIFATHITQTMSHSIRILDSAGTPYYIMCTDAATNRGGGS